MRFGIDWAWGTPNIGQLRRDGVTFACRYLSYDDSKDLSHDEARRLSEAGIQIVVIWETTAGRAAQGYDAGRQDARVANLKAAECGQPHHRPIYFAVDFDADPATVAPYFKGVASVIGTHRTGAYAGVRVIRGLFDEHLIRYGWQTYAWSFGAWDQRAQLHQYSNDHQLGGVDCDLDRGVHHDFGQWQIASGLPGPAANMPAKAGHTPQSQNRWLRRHPVWLRRHPRWRRHHPRMTHRARRRR